LAARRDAVMQDCGDEDLPRKFEARKKENHELVSNLVRSVFHPVDRVRLRNYVANIKLEEINGGFKIYFSGKIRSLRVFQL
jgi:hypothetical protein